MSFFLQHASILRRFVKTNLMKPQEKLDFGDWDETVTRVLKEYEEIIKGLIQIDQWGVVRMDSY